MKTISIQLDWDLDGTTTNVWTLDQMEITQDNKQALIDAANVAFDAIAEIPEDAVVSLRANSGDNPIFYSAVKNDFLASEYNQVRLSRLNDDEGQGISQEIADLIKQYIQSFVKQ